MIISDKQKPVKETDKHIRKHINKQVEEGKKNDGIFYLRE